VEWSGVECMGDRAERTTPVAVAGLRDSAPGPRAQGAVRVIGDDALGRSGWDEARPRGTNEARKASLTIISQEKKPF
jgi:hypothetical protein